jgi:hypothetical protein
MFTEISTSTSAPPASSRMSSSGSCNGPPLRLFRGIRTRAAVISSPNIQRTMSISWTAVSVIALSFS